MRTVLTFMLVTGIVACGGGTPAGTTPTPVVEARALTPSDSLLKPIAMAAARSLKPGADGKINFGGVFVGGRELVALGDTIARAIGATSTAGKVPFAICRIGSPGCGAGTGSPDPFSYTFRSFRAAGTNAFVGASAPSAARPDGAICIELQWTGLAWEVKNRRNVSSAETCGR
jgi:hypothetical protein